MGSERLRADWDGGYYRDPRRQGLDAPDDKSLDVDVEAVVAPLGLYATLPAMSRALLVPTSVA